MLLRQIDRRMAGKRKPDHTAQLRDQINRSGLPAWADRKDVSTALLKLLELSRAGLLRRGRGEERFLNPLYPRAEQLLSPSQELSDALRQGIPMESMIRRFASLNES